ncbi:hypothetical protein D9M72_591750 [compost metagenome]
MVRQHDQQIIFLRRQTHRFAITRHQTLDRIDRHAIGRKLGMPALHLDAVAKGGADARRQLTDPEGLFDVIIGAEIKGGDLFALPVTCRQNDDRHLRPGADVGDDVLAVHVGQAQVEDHDVGRGGRRRLQCLCSRQSLQHVIAGSAERRS